MVESQPPNNSGELGATLPFTVRPGALSKVLIEPAQIAPDIGTTRPYTFQALDRITRITRITMR